MRKTARLSSSGQALLIILLVMAVVLTGALSIVSRSITDITVSQKEEESSRAFSAAEAGVEQALVGLPATCGTPSDPCELSAGGKYSVESTSLAAGNEFVLPQLLNSGEIAPVWFVAHDDNGNIVCSAGKPCFTGDKIKVCWGASGTSRGTDTTPAIEVSVFYTQGSGGSASAKIARGAYDPNSTRTGTNKFFSDDIGSSCSIGSTQFAFSKTIDLASLGVTTRTDGSQEKGPQFARLRIFYNTDKAHPVGVTTESSGLLPNQGKKIESTGKVGDVTRKIQFFQLFSDIPPVLDSGIFSAVGGITKAE